MEQKSTQKEKIRIGIIGCGKQANIHVQAMLETDLFSIVALCDVSTENINTLAAAIGSDSSIFATNDYKACIDYPIVDAVLISTRTYQHVEQALYAIEKKKHVLMEKPLGISVQEVNQLTEVALKTKDIVVYPALEYRHSYFYENMMHFIHSDFLDGTKYISINEYRNPFFLPWFYDKSLSGGAINDKLIHFFDVLCGFFAPSKPVSVYASGSQHVYTAGSFIKGVTDEKYKLEKSDIIDNAIVIVEFEDDKRAVVQLNMYEEFPVSGLTIHIAGLNGTYIKVTHADTPELEITTNKDGNIQKYTMEDRRDSDKYGIGHPGAKELLISFYDAVVKKETPRVDMYGARLSQLITFAAEQSVAEGRKILLSEYTNKTIETLAKERGAGYRERFILHDMKLVPEEKKKKIRRGIIWRFFGTKNVELSYIRLTKATLSRILRGLKKKYDLSAFRDISVTIHLITPWDSMYFRVANGDIILSSYDIAEQDDKLFSITLTERGFEGFLSGESLNRLYLTKQVQVKGNLFEVRQFRPLMLKLLEELKKQLLIK
ncbi:MAG: Gfo/Idh/MocA family oxidoreductase [Candidatus Dojkabacteria bacterium]|nr:MAG: Gfo/Idh/MocA family oxidoreductase [Candidatus Dojkabacteria bacterium]